MSSKQISTELRCHIYFYGCLNNSSPFFVYILSSQYAKPNLPIRCRCLSLTLVTRCVRPAEYEGWKERWLEGRMERKKERKKERREGGREGGREVVR